MGIVTIFFQVLRQRLKPTNRIRDEAIAELKAAAEMIKAWG